MSKDVTIDDLKYGYLVEFRNGYKGLYMPCQTCNVFEVKDNLGRNIDVISNYTNNLKHHYSDKWDVMKIFGFTNVYHMTTELTTDNRPLIWERKKRETVQMTVGEMKEKLEELLDKNVKVDPSITELEDLEEKQELIRQLIKFCSKQKICNTHCTFFTDSHNCEFHDMTIEQLRDCYERIK